MQDTLLIWLHIKKPPEMGGAHKTVNRRNSLISCACSCIFDQIMITYNQLDNLKIVGGAIMIYLMRHGADPSERYGGWSAYGLTEKGREQVHSAKSNLRNKGITQIYSSDLVRAKETAEIVANALSLEITYLPQFRESNNGLLAGMLKTEAVEKYPGVYWNALDWTETWPEGESPEQFFQRIQNAWYEFKKQAGKSNVLLVSHGGVMNIILCLENGIPYTNKETHFQIKDAEIVQIDI